MFRLIKQVFIDLLSFSGSLTTKYMFFNNEPCMIRPNLIDLDPVELNYYPFMICLDKCNGSCFFFFNLYSIFDLNCTLYY